jgi:exodeoxyribonuclease VII small subunit
LDDAPLPPYLHPVPASKKNPGSEPSFEEAVERIESLIEDIETGRVGLDQSLKAFEEGMALIRACRSRIERAEQRVAELLEDESEENDAQNERGDDG